MKNFKQFLEGGDLRSLDDADELVELIDHQEAFDKLFKYLFSGERLISMRAIDSVEKITRKHPEFLGRYNSELLQLMDTANHKEFKWHLAQLISRVDFRGSQLIRVWKQLTDWAVDKSESKIVRVNSLQALYDIQQSHPEFREDFHNTSRMVQKDGIKSINARIRQFKQREK